MMGIFLKKGQGIIEFVIIFGAILFFFLIFFLTINSTTQDSLAEQKSKIATEIALNIKEEISLAHGSSNGYERNFTIPLDLLGKSYDLNITEFGIYVYAENIGVSYSVLNVTGKIKKGVNTIKKIGDGVFLNV